VRAIRYALAGTLAFAGSRGCHKMTTQSYSTPEYTGFVEFDRFVLMCVMFSPLELEKKNIRKLRGVLR
jgi:hypothetical protein